MTRLAELRALLAKATHPWTVDEDRRILSVGLLDPDQPKRGREIVSGPLGEQNAALIVAAVNALPALLDVASGLANQRPPIYDGMYCMLCHKHTDDESDGWEMKPENHAESCPWLLSRALMVPNVIGDEK